MINGLNNNNNNNRNRSFNINGQNNQQNTQQDLSLTKQLGDFWGKVGLFTRICFITNAVAYAYQVGMKRELTEAAICLAPVLDYQQFYRIVTSEFSHGNVAHIFFNMCGLLVFGVEVEKTYGTLYYAMINFWLMMISNILSLAFFMLMAFVIPEEYRGGTQNFFYCGVGYSNILFGLSIIFAYKGDTQQNFMGLCKFEKKYVPWFYMILIFFTIENSSFIGHFLGMITGLLIKFGGLYVLFPRYEWLRAFDDKFEHKLEKISFKPVTDEITKDFNAYFITSTTDRVKMAIQKIRHKLMGYNYIRPQHDPVICPDSIELVQRQ